MFMEEEDCVALGSPEAFVWQVNSPTSIHLSLQDLSIHLKCSLLWVQDEMLISELFIFAVHLFCACSKSGMFSGI
jgi:hypothetical protein